MAKRTPALSDPMEPAEYRRLIAQAGLSQRKAGPFFGMGERQSRRFAGDDAEIPRGVAFTLRLMAKFNLTAGDLDPAFAGNTAGEIPPSVKPKGRARHADR